MLPPESKSSARLRMYALVSLTITCVLSTTIEANQHNVSNNNESGQNESRETVEPKEPLTVEQGRSLKYNSQYPETSHRAYQKPDVYRDYRRQYPSYAYNRRSYDSYPYNQYSQDVAQDRYHPTTYEETEGEGEVREGPFPSDSTQSGSDQSVVKDSYLQAAFSQDSVPQGSENNLQPETPPLSPYSEPQVAAYSYGPPAPSGGYDYHPPPPPPSTEGYFYPPPSNQYLPVPEPEETRQTTDYTYYYLGPKLWYIPLFFSVYFVLYVAALIIKAIAKHKIIFPQQMFAAATSVLSEARGDIVNQAVSTVATALSEAAKKYL